MTETTHGSSDSVGKRFAALKQAFQRATGTGFTQMSPQAMQQHLPVQVASAVTKENASTCS
jgi:hypothetical protein